MDPMGGVLNILFGTKGQYQGEKHLPPVTLSVKTLVARGTFHQTFFLKTLQDGLLFFHPAPNKPTLANQL